MSVATTDLVQHWSMRDVDASRRLDYYACALTESVTPMSVDDADVSNFHGELSTALFGEIRVTKTSGAAHRAFRGRAEIARSSAHSFNLLIGLRTPWTTECGGPLRLLPRDVLLFDSEQTIVNDVRADFTAVNVSLPESWLRRWLPDPRVLSSRRIPGDSLWGLTLASYLSELTPELVANPPLPISVIADQVGSLLAVTANAMRSDHAPTLATRSLYERICECIRQRSAEEFLTAAEVAAAVDVSVRTLHRTLSAAHVTFGGLLIDARAQTGIRLLTSPAFKRVTTAEIGRRAGFPSAPHFARVIRSRTGLTPLKLRKAVHDGLVEPRD